MCRGRRPSVLERYAHVLGDAKSCSREGHRRRCIDEPNVVQPQQGSRLGRPCAREDRGDGDNENRDRATSHPTPF
jgi:hypothetical protein